MSKSIRLKNNDILVHDWAALLNNGRKTLTPSAWQPMEYPFTVGTDYFFTNNNDIFEFVTDGIKCKFKGAFLMIQEMTLAPNLNDNEFDLIDDYSTFYQTRGTVKYLISIFTCNKNDVKKLKYITGVSSFECYNARLFLMRIA